MATFSEKVVLTILPLFLTTYFQLKFSKLCPTKHRTKNRSYFANNKYVIEVSTATTGPDMTFLFVYFGLKHPVLNNAILGSFVPCRGLYPLIWFWHLSPSKGPLQWEFDCISNFGQIQNTFTSSCQSDHFGLFWSNPWATMTSLYPL